MTFSRVLSDSRFDMSASRDFINWRRVANEFAFPALGERLLADSVVFPFGTEALLPRDEELGTELIGVL